MCGEEDEDGGTEGSSLSSSASLSINKEAISFPVRTLTGSELVFWGSERLRKCMAVEADAAILISLKSEDTSFWAGLSKIAVGISCSDSFCLSSG